MNLEKLLNQQVGNLILFYVKLHNYHWFVDGPHFYGLHEKYEEMYDEVTEMYDEIAERMLMLGYKPVGTLKESLAVATLKDATNKDSCKEMIQAVLDDYKQLDKEYGEILEVAGDLGDDVTEDILTTHRVSFQKHIWMLAQLLK